MESLEFVQDTTLSDNGIHEVLEPEKDLTDERERRLRLLAEFDNYRRRTKEERALAEETGKREVLLALLDVIDDFDRALLHIGERSDSVADGLRLIHQRLNNVLETNAQKVALGALRYGFAARCEARLCLAVTLVKYIWG